MPREQNAVSLTREQKAGFGLLLVFGIAAVALGFIQTRNTLYSPFQAQKVARDLEKGSVSALYDDRTRLQQIDTDQDGLNDYEEIEFYNTSAYIADTDSDGIDDKTEIDRGGDPLCPEGKECAASRDEEGRPSTSTPASPLLGITETSGDILGGALESVEGGAGSADAFSGVDLEALQNDPQAIRQLLLASGKISQEQLAHIDDAALLDLVKQIIAEEGGASTGAP